MLAHIVYFTLKDSSKEALQQMVAACQKYLSGHPGEVHFSAGVRAQQYDREVNDKTFHVALHLVFATAADHDAYQVADRHKQFIAENKESWSDVRVFDSEV